MITGEAIAVEGLRMRYGPTDVLHDVTFRTVPGEVLAVLGPNGAGKTTTMEILEGFRGRSAGRVTVLGTDPAHGDERWRARLGIVLQSWRDHGKWRVRELLAHLRGYYVRFDRPALDTDELIAAVGLAGQAGQTIRRLSGGQRRRLDVAIGIVGRPDVLFLDEPTVGFDPRARHEFHELIRDLAGRYGTTILLTTHDLDEAERVADRIVILDGGRIVADGTAAELTRRIAGRDDVRWTLDGEALARSVPASESTAFVRDLFRRHGDAVTDLEVRRSSLAEAYLSLVGER